MILCNCVIPNYRKFLNISANNALLALFICTCLVEPLPDMLAEEQTITVAAGFADDLRVMSIKGQDVTEVPNLF